ncbi:MAG: DUF4347 domain-containing protein, partial [Magnetococcales bacterium]|nr:DUF4347 domain-containing protein [Magnetococcales bacterium]
MKLFARTPPPGACNTATRRGRGKPFMLVLEPRMMFDGAAVATVVDYAHDAPDAAARALIPDVPAPVEVKVVDPTLNNGKKEVAFIDGALPEAQTLAAMVRPGVEIELLDGAIGGLEQIAKWAATHDGYDAIHLLSHGTTGTLELAHQTLTTGSFADDTIQAELAALGYALKAGGDLLLYGCSIGADDSFAAGLAAGTGADVAASIDATGLGSNWILENQTGPIQTDSPFDPDRLADFDTTLAVGTLVNGGNSGTVTWGTVSATQIVAGANTGMTANQVISASNNLSTGFDIYAKNSSSGSTSFTIRNQSGSGMTGTTGAYVRAVANTGYTPQYLEMRANRGIFDLDSIKIGSTDTTTVSSNYTVQALDSNFNLKGASVGVNGVAKTTFYNLDVSSNTDFDAIYGVRITISSSNTIAVGDIKVTNPRDVSTNTAPAFVGATTTLTLNQNALATDIKSLLHISDVDSAQTLTWSQKTAPTRGTLTLTGATATSGSSDVTPGGTLTYTPNAGYAGSDSFEVQVSDGSATVSRTITVTVNPAAPGAPDLAAASDTGSSNTDNITSASSLSFSGSGAIASGTVTVFIDSNNNGSKDTGELSTTATADSSGNWSAATINASTLSNGSYNVKAYVTSGSVTSPVGSALAVTLDRTSPTAGTPAVNNVTSSGGTSHSFTVAYADTGAGLDTTSIAAGNVTITGPNSFTASVTGATLSGGTATYTFTPPGGSWDNGDNGTYTIALGASPAKDQAGNALASLSGTFTVDIPSPVLTNVRVNSTADNTTAGDGLVTFREALLAIMNGATTDLGDVGGAGSTILFDATVFDPATKSETERTIKFSSNLPTVTKSFTVNGDVNGDSVYDVLLHGGDGNGNSGLTSSTDNVSLTLRSVCMTYFSSSNTPSSYSTLGSAVQLKGSGSSLTITDSTFNNNKGGPYSYANGAIMVNATSGTLSVDRSYFHSNSSSVEGGAIYFSGSTATISNSVFYLNSGLGGGAVYVKSGNVNLYN